MKHSCFKWLAMNRMTDQIMTEEKWVFHQTSTKEWMFQVPGVTKTIFTKIPATFWQWFSSGSGFQAISPCALLQRWGRSCHPTPNVPASRMEGVDGWYASFLRIQSSTPGWDLILNLHLPLLEGEHVSKLQHDLKL